MRISRPRVARSGDRIWGGPHYHRMFSRSALRKVARTAGVTLEHPLGRGGQGVVWRVFPSTAPSESPRPMALKVCGRRTPAQRQAFEHEAYVGTSARGPGLVGTEAVFRGPGWGALLQPWVDGISLAVLLGLWKNSGRVLGSAAATVLLHDLAEALAPVHHLGGRGWVHGDVTPHNIVVDRAGRVALLDLGAAHPAGRPAARIVGHVGYMAPEQAAGAVLSPAADGYGVGGVLKEALGPAGCEASEVGQTAQGLMLADPSARPRLSSVALGLHAETLARGRTRLAAAVRECIGHERACAEIRPRAAARAAQRRAKATRSGGPWIANYRWLTAAAGFGVVVGSLLRAAAAP